MRTSEELLKLGPRKRDLGFERNPMGAGEVGSWENPWPLHCFGEFLVAAFQREPVFAGFEAGDGVHFPSHLEY